MEVLTSDTRGATLALTRSELSLIMNAIFDICHGGVTPVEEWEFPTRMDGLERFEAFNLAERIRDLL